MKKIIYFIKCVLDSYITFFTIAFVIIIEFHLVLNQCLSTNNDLKMQFIIFECAEALMWLMILLINRLAKNYIKCIIEYRELDNNSNNIAEYNKLYKEQTERFENSFSGMVLWITIYIFGIGLLISSIALKIVLPQCIFLFLSATIGLQFWFSRKTFNTFE